MKAAVCAKSPVASKLAATLLLALTPLAAAAQAGGEAPLKGAAQIKVISATAVKVTNGLLKGCRSSRFQCVAVRLRNTGEQIVTVDADKATAYLDGQAVTAASEEELVKKSGCGMSPATMTILTTVGLGTAGLAEPVLRDVIAPEKYPAQQYGRDGYRLRVEGKRFGRVAVLPGDDITGWICFPAGLAAEPSRIEIPATSSSESGVVLVEMVKSARSSPAP